MKAAGLIFWSMAATGISAGACAAQQPQLGRLYGWARKAPRRPVVLVHGILGSLLHDPSTGREVWPGGFWRLVLHDFSDLALPSRETLVANGVFTGAAGSDFYSRLIETLVRFGGYHLRTGPEGRRTLYPFFYDWRLGNAANAARLDDFIEAIRREHRAPDLQLDLVAHSMGGLLARYYVRFGRRDVLGDPRPSVTYAGGKKIHRMILVASPNAGSAPALKAAVEGERLGLRLIPPEVIATWPSFAQLFPTRQGGSLVDRHGRPIRRDLYDIATWRAYRWSIFAPEVRARVRRRHPGSARRVLRRLAETLARNLERARRFHRALSVPAPPGPVRAVIFGGDCVSTPSRYVLERLGGRVHLRTRPEDIVVRAPSVDYRRLMFEPGDGRITKPSALARTSSDLTDGRTDAFFPVAYAMFLCADHGDLPGDATFRDNLLHVLLAG